ncbi:MAG: glycosyltransferase family 39 protein, partial [Phycisphaerae bacterium]
MGETALLDNEPRQLRLAIAVIALAIFFLYLPTVLSAGFVDIDDGQYVVQNDVVRNASFSSAWRFVREVTQPSTVVGYYQPLTMISLMIDAWLCGGEPDPFIFHLTSVLWHVLNTVLLFLIVRAACGGVVVPVLAALIFGMHPVQVESVAWVSQRKTVLASAGALAAVLIYLRAHQTHRPRWLWAALAAYVLAMLAKPTAMFLPFFLLLLDVWPLRRTNWRASVLEKWPFALFMVAGALVAIVSQTRTAGIGAPNPSQWVNLAKLAAYNLMLYGGNLIRPTRLALIYEEPGDLSWGSLPIAAAVTLVMIGVIVWISSWRWSRPLFVGLGGAAVLLGVAIGPVRFMQSCIGDRFMYLPLAALALPLAAGADRLWRSSDRRTASTLRRRRGLVLAGGLAVVAWLAGLTLNQQEVWADTERLWSNVLARVPNHGMGNAGLGGSRVRQAQELIGLGDRESAEELLNQALTDLAKAIDVDPDNGLYHENRAEALMLLNRGDEAVAAAQAALSKGLGPMERQGRVSLGRAMLKAGRVEEARGIFDEVMNAAGTRYALRMQMGFAMIDAKRPALAMPYFQSAVRAAPADPQALQMLGVSAATAGAWQTAADAYERVAAFYRARGASSPEVTLSLSKVYLELNRPDDAELGFRDAGVAKHFPAQQALGMAGVAALRGDLDAAFNHLRLAL